MNPPTAWETRAAQSKTYRRLSKMGGRIGGARLARILDRMPGLALPQSNLPAEANPRGTIEGLRPMSAATLETVFTGAASTDLPPRHQVASIAVPALILAWPNDPTHPVETAIELDRLLPDTRLHIAGGPADVSRWPVLIRDFVRSIT
jgi:pimeloyl-ACP methyl ester carboxylesterase